MMDIYENPPSFNERLDTRRGYGRGAWKTGAKKIVTEIICRSHRFPIKRARRATLVLLR